MPISTLLAARGVPAIKLSRREWLGVGPRLTVVLPVRLPAPRAVLPPLSTLLCTGPFFSSLPASLTNGNSSPLSRAYCCLTQRHNMPATRLHDSTDDGVSCGLCM